MKILWCSDFLGDLDYPYPTGSATLAYNVITRLLDKKIDIIVADKNASDHQNIITPSRKSAAKVYYYKNDEITDISNRIKPTTIVTDSYAVSTFLISNLIDCPPIILIAKDINKIKSDKDSYILKDLNIVTPSSTVKEELKSIGISSTYIPPGVDTNFFSCKDSISSIPKSSKTKRFIFGCVCKNSIEKNIIELLSAYKIFNDNFKDGSILAIHTYDNGYYNIEKISKYLGINQNIFYGRYPVDLKDMNSIYNTFDVHINIGGNEWSGFSTLESLACKIPNIVANYGILSDYINSITGNVLMDNSCSPYTIESSHDKILHDGIVVNTIKINDLVEKMEEMWLNEEMRNIDNSEMISRYNWSTTSELFEDFLFSI